MMNEKKSPIDTLRSRIRSAGGHALPRAEVWLGTALFQYVKMADTAENHIRMAEGLGQSLVCLPVCQGQPDGPPLGYRYFNPTEVGQAAKLSDLPVAAVIDGPFQQMVNQMGLMQVFTLWMSERDGILKRYEELTQAAMMLAEQVMAHPMAALIVADDFASETGPLVRPSDLETLCTPFYTRIIAAAQQRGIPVFLHSCGRLDRLIPMFKRWQLNGFAAVQSRINDLPALYNAFDTPILIMGGIETDLLDRGDLGEDGGLGLETTMTALGSDLIFCSSCGLYEGRFYDQIQKIYREVDKVEQG